MGLLANLAATIIASYMARLFISTDRLEAWTAEGRAELEGEQMTLVELSRSFAIKPAVRFLAVTGSDLDPHDLVGQVLDMEQLATLGADHMADSVIYVDTAYSVQNGFLGEPIRS